MEGAVLTSAKSKGKVACVAVPRDLHSRTIFNVWIDRSCVPKGSLPVRTASVYQIRLSVTNEIVVEIAQMSCQLGVVSIFSLFFDVVVFPVLKRLCVCSYRAIQILDPCKNFVQFVINQQYITDKKYSNLLSTRLLENVSGWLQRDLSNTNCGLKKKIALGK